MITKLEYEKALKIVSAYELQISLDNSFSQATFFKLENHFRSDTVKAFYNCYEYTFGIRKKKLSLDDVKKLDITTLHRFRGFGKRSEIILKELCSE